jgi:phospholipid/cholesterol/gamma-HCH transport system substrate-binding protein
MSAAPNSFKIGLFVLLGTGLLIAGLFAFGARSYFQQRRVFETYVPGVVQGLSAGSPVTLRGVAIGKVTYVGFVWNEYPQIKDRYVLIEWEVPKDTSLLPPTTNLQAVLDVEIAFGLRARVQARGINPASDLALDYLDTNQNPLLKFSWTPKHYYIPSAPGQFTEILTSIERITRNLEKVDFPEIAARLDKGLGAVDVLITNVARVDFGQLGTNANALVAELRATNTRLQATLAATQGAIQETDLPAIGRNTQALEARLSDVTGELQRVLAGVNSNDLNETLANAREASEQLNGLLSELKQQPSSLLFSKPPPPAQSVETPRWK